MVVFLLVLFTIHSLLNTKTISLHFFFKPIVFLFSRFLILLSGWRNTAIQIETCLNRPIAKRKLNCPAATSGRPRPEMHTHEQLNRQHLYSATRVVTLTATVTAPATARQHCKRMSTLSGQFSFFTLAGLSRKHRRSSSSSSQGQVQVQVQIREWRAESATLPLLLKELSAAWKRKRLKVNFGSHLRRAHENYWFMCVLVCRARGWVGNMPMYVSFALGQSRTISDTLGHL